MIEIETTVYGSLMISDDYSYAEHEYKHLVDLIKTQWKPHEVVSVHATGHHMVLISAFFGNMSRPHFAKGSKRGYIWYGDEAKTIFANIALALQYNTSHIVLTLEDYKKGIK